MSLNGCDTLIATSGDTVSGNAIFAKNSDRPPTETQPLVKQDRKTHNPNTVNKLEFISLPETEVSYKHVGSRPYWCWGYEHGFNEHQVVIGNEALQSRLRPGKPTLTGMDLVRIGLERGSSAREALNAMTSVIESVGQGKFAHPDGYRTYDNGFIIADPKEAYVLETAGHEWAARKVQKSQGISNTYSISNNWDLISENALHLATQSAEYKGNEQLDFREFFKEDTKFSYSADQRELRSCALLDHHAGNIDIAKMISILSDHSGEGFKSKSKIEAVESGYGICMHSDSVEKGSNTAASLIAELCSDETRLPIYWTSMYSPCTGIFLPTFIEGVFNTSISLGGKKSSQDSAWWVFYYLNQSLKADDNEAIVQLREKFDVLQNEFFSTAYDLAEESYTLIKKNRNKDVKQKLTCYMDTNFRRVIDIAMSFIKTDIYSQNSVNSKFSLG
ncbi:MAG: hypothetical protein CL904_02075 [Dehalococcoidia bacterium]|nr:hypothetical protein [Dehalococcoidia bacterium]MQG16627.1 hypothetical protein [SAR202 cluster bacterium]|tara:strand:- start:648 stop:1985 length:1338 start_codon:yes stop_codon:yes gene_type:complete